MLNSSHCHNQVSHQTNRDLSLPGSSWRTVVLFRTIIFRKSLLFTWCCDWEEECRFSLKLWRAKLSLLKLSRRTRLKMSKQKFRTKKVTSPLWFQVNRYLRTSFYWPLLSKIFVFKLIDMLHVIVQESLPISNVLFLLESNWKTVALFPITTFRKSLLFTWYCAWEEVCRFSSRL